MLGPTHLTIFMLLLMLLFGGGGGGGGGYGILYTAQSMYVLQYKTSVKHTYLIPTLI